MTSFAQSRHKKRWAKVDSLLQERRKRPPIYDTTYIVRPDYKLTTKVRANLSGNGIHARGTVKGIHTRANLHTSNKQTFSIAAIYQGVAAGIALNPAKLFGHYHDYELNLNIYSSQISLDASFQRSKTLSGDIERESQFHLESGNADMKVLNVAAYYAFNYRRFSYPAAFTQSHIQRRSAGSWLAGIAFQEVPSRIVTIVLLLFPTCISVCVILALAEVMATISCWARNGCSTSLPFPRWLC